MPTDEYKPLLDRDEAVVNAAPFVEAACPLLREVVNHASWAFRQCDAATDAHGDENEDLAPFVLYRQLIELTDGTEVLLRVSCVDASVPLIRAAFEASLSLDFTLNAEYRRRSLTWTCAYLHSRIDAHERLDVKTQNGGQLATAFSAEMGERTFRSTSQTHQ